MEARSGDFILGADIRADGGHASSSDGSGGMAILGGYNGAPAGQLLGNGPGRPAESSEQGHGAGHGGHGSGGASETGHPHLGQSTGGKFWRFFQPGRLGCRWRVHPIESGW